MPLAQTGLLISAPLYTSPNGDCWRLVCDEASRRILVRNEANRASGGHVTEMEVQHFLWMTAASPERDAGLAMVGAAGADLIEQSGGRLGVRLRVTTSG